MSTTRVYAYGCLPPIANGEMVREQIFQAHRYKNRLIELARKEIADYRAIRARHSPEVEGLEARQREIESQLETINEEYKRRRLREVAASMREASSLDKKAPRARRTKYPDLDEQIASLRSTRKDIGARLKAARDSYKAILAVGEEEYRRRIRAMAVADGKDPEAIPPTCRGDYNERARREMLSEPQWPAAWKATAASKLDIVLHKKAARAACGVPQGTYGLVEAAVDQARQESDSPEGPRFQRFTGDGSLGVQIQGGMTADELFSGEDTRLRCRIVPRSNGNAASSGRRTHVQRAMLDIRIGSVGQKPVWATFPVVIHRPLPDGAVVKWAKIVTWRQGSGLRRELQLTIEKPDVARNTAGLADGLALHLAWRKVDGGLRVGYVVGSDGHEEDIVMSDESGDVLNRLQHADALRGIADQHFNEAKRVFVEWLALSGDQAPAWMLEETTHTHAWRSHGKLAKVARRWVAELFGEIQAGELWTRWRKERLAAGFDLFASREKLDEWFTQAGGESPPARLALYLEWWRRKNSHLETWEADLRAKALARRKNDRRVLMARFAKRYRTIAIESADLREAAARAPTEGNDALHEAARLQRVRSCPSELRDIAKAAFGESVVKVHAAAADVCGSCGGSFSAEPKQLFGRCANGHIEDRDRNACRNMLRMAGIASGGGDGPVPVGARSAKKRASIVESAGL
jgi:hypothetical protein